MPGVARAPGADESGNTVPRTGGCPDERAVGARGARISRRASTLGAETGVSPPACPVRLRGVSLRQLFSWRSWWNNGDVFGKVVVTIRVLLENPSVSGLRGVSGRALGPDLAFMTRCCAGHTGFAGDREPR